MRTILVPIVLALAISLTGAAFFTSAQAAPGAPHRHAAAAGAAADASAIAKQYAFRAEMRRLWEDHVTWTRQVVVSVLAGAPDTDAALARLLRNQEDIGNAMRPFYGDAAGDRLTALLKDHIVTAGRLLAAAKSGDAVAVAAASGDWYANGHDIAVFLASANPNWTLADLDAAMRTHLDTTLDEALARLRSDWDADVAAYDRVHAHILVMADVLANGIIAQFPAAFAR